MRFTSSSISVLTLLLLAGCVSTQTYDDKVSELSACRDELAACKTKAAEDLQACTRAKKGTEDFALVCLKEAKAAKARADQLTAREAELRSKLDTEITARNVEIEKLKDQLSVRVLDRILFRSGSAQILDEGKLVLDKLADAVTDSDETIRVEGHTDNVPIHPRLQPKYFSNWELSGARAASVVRYFQDQHQIDPLRMEAVGLSKYRPVASNDDEAGRQRNRRVELLLKAAKKEI
jgi:flagellar motor protein MotB